MVGLPHLGEGARVGQGQTGLLGEDAQQLQPLADAEGVAADERDQAADGRALDVNRGGDRGLSPFRRGRGMGHRRVGGHRRHGGREDCRLVPQQRGCVAGRRYDRLVATERVGQHQRDEGVVEEPRRAFGDGLQDLLQRPSVGDRALDAEQGLEQPLPAAEGVEQHQAPLGLLLPLGTQVALGGERLQVAQRQAEDAGHAMQHLAFLRREVVGLAAEHQGRLESGPER